MPAVSIHYTKRENTGEPKELGVLRFGEGSGGGAGRDLSLSTPVLGDNFSPSCRALRSLRSFSLRLLSS